MSKRYGRFKRQLRAPVRGDGLGVRNDSCLVVGNDQTFGAVIDRTGSIANPTWPPAVALAVAHANAGLDSSAKWKGFHYEGLVSDSDPPTRGWDAIFAERVPGARGQPHQIQARAGHFWQEDNGPEAARIIADWIESTR